MTNRMIGVLLAASLAFATATPARAGSDNFERFLLGATTILIIGSILNQRHERVDRRYAHAPHVYRRDRALPGYCLETWRTRGHGTIRFFGRQCLVRHAGYEPRVCREVIHGPRGARVVYREHCLLRHGYYVY